VSNVFFDINNADITLSGPLPVILTGFAATTRDTTTLLHWATAQELHNAGFEVQLQGPHNPEFRKVAFIASRGITSQNQTYELALPDLAPGSWYVRLQQLDEADSGAGGSFSAVQSFVIESQPMRASLWHNPLVSGTGTASVYLPDAGTVQITLYDLLERPVCTLPTVQAAAGLTDVPLLLPALAAGLYAWRLTAGRWPSVQGRELLLP